MNSITVSWRLTMNGLRASADEHWRTHRLFWAAAAIFAVARVLAGWYLRPGGYLTDQVPDAPVYVEMMRLNYGGLAPFRDYWLEYPPIFAWILQAVGALSLQIPPLYDPVYVPNGLLRLVLAVFDVGNLALIYATARQVWGPERGLVTAGLWALAFTPLVTFLGWYEPLALFFLLLTLYAIVTDRPILAGLAMGLGFCVKVFPAVLGPLALLGARTWRQRAMVAVAAAAAVLVVFGPLFLQTPVYVEAWFRNLLARSSWETIWAFLDGYLGYGVVAPLRHRNDPLAAQVASTPGNWPGIVIMLVTAAGFLWVTTRRLDWTDRKNRARFGLFSIVLFMLISKGFSPQWHSFVLALVLLALPLRSAVAYVIAGDLLFMAEYPLALAIFIDQPWAVVGVVILRTGLMAAIAVEAVARLWPTVPLARLVARTVLPVTLGVIAAVGIGAVPVLSRSYAANRLSVEPLQSLIQAVDADQASGVIVAQAQVFERLTPYLPSESVLYLPNGQGTPWRDVEAWTRQTLAGRDRIWLVLGVTSRSDSDQELHDQIRSQVETWGCPVVRTWLSTDWIGQYVSRPTDPRIAPGGVFANGVELRAIALPDAEPVAGGALCVELDWSTGAALDRDLTVFVHVLDPAGQLVAQSDLAPEVGTSGWVVGEEHITRHGLVVPQSAGPGPFMLAVGLYDPTTGERAPTAAGGDRIDVTP